MFGAIAFLLGLTLIGGTSTTDHIPVTDIQEFLSTGSVTRDSTIDFPTFLTSTILVSVNPLDQVLDSSESNEFAKALSYFYEQVFNSQTEYDLTVRAVDVIDQNVDESDQRLEMKIIVDVNFRPHPSNQEMTDYEFHNILLNLVNHFEQQFVTYLQTRHDTFGPVQSAFAKSPDGWLSASNTTSEDAVWLAVITGVGCFVIVSALIASYVLYKREWGKPRYVSGLGAFNISPFGKEDGEISFANKDTLMLVDDEAYEANPRFSFRPSEVDPDSPPTAYSSPSSRRSVPPPLPSLSLDAEAGAASAELWAPAGKLGVAIDVVDGEPLVWRIKSGSPLEGFLEKGDVIVAIDEIDTRHMSAADITSVMVRRMRQRRKITYIRKDK